MFDRVEAIEPYGPEDRRGPGLDDLAPSAQPYVVDVSIWPSEDWDEARDGPTLSLTVINLTGGQIVHQAIGTRRSVLRVSVNDEGLSNLLGYKRRRAGHARHRSPSLTQATGATST